MAGHGSRFAKAGFQDPKPLIPIHGKPMIQWVIKNLTPRCEHRFIFIVQREHIDRYGLQSKLQIWAPNSIVVPLDNVTDGAARTALMAKDYINNEHPLVIANSDQWIEASFDSFVNELTNDSIDGLVMTMWADDPKWSFVDLDDGGFVSNVVEKDVISNSATVGVYGFSRGCDFVSAVEEMISDDFRVNDEFYVAPAYNWLVKRGHKIGTFDVGAEQKGMYGLGIPSDLALFENSPISSSVWAS